MLIAARVHPFPYRTRKLSSLALKILGGKLPGKISRCQHLQIPVNKQSLQVFLFIAKLIKTNDSAESVTNGSKKYRVIVNRTKTAYKSPELSFFGLKVNYEKGR